MRTNSLLVLFLALLVCSGCTQGESGPTPSRLAQPLVRDYVHRGETIATARAYLDHEWLPERSHIFHGNDSSGIRVDTPDIGIGERGWWRVGRVNRGMPYKWGGFDTPGSFDAGLAEGKFAGDIYSAEKRRQLDGAVSRQAVGIDCSGFISRCWKLPRSYSTRELPSISIELGSYEQLQAGDILNVHNKHVLLFEKFTDASKTQMVVYEAGSPPSWKVLRNQTPVAFLKGLGYKPYRYKNIHP